MVAENNGMSAVLSRYHDEDIAFVSFAFLVEHPSAKHGEVKIGLPVKRQFTAKGNPLHAGIGDGFSVAINQIVAEAFQISVSALNLRYCDLILHDIGIVLMDEPAMRQSLNVIPPILFKTAVCRF